ncbi:MAG: hypothetical protein NTU53_23270 [Planctomycetota bacterium]|nr:hypothetical protein [Planctomycetota bacterium]
MAARTIILGLLAFAIIGCNRAAPTNRVPRQASAPGVPGDPRLAKFIGDWTEDDRKVVLSITRNADGSGCISSPANAVWDEVINNVRLEGDTLRYDSYNYYKGKEDFRTITNTVGDHPYSGVCNEVTLSPNEDPNTLKQKLVTKVTPKGVEGTLRRRSGGG